MKGHVIECGQFRQRRGIALRLEAPLEAKLVDELFEFWLPIFGLPNDLNPETLLGLESPQSLITAYTRRLGDRLAGTCLVIRPEAMPDLGGFSEVATSPDARRTGIATALSIQARDDFRERGGSALFLGTVNPDAARIYFRLGWRKLAGANVMVNVMSGDSPEEYLVNFFRDLGPATVGAASPSDRVPMIPALLSPHDWQVLDLNVEMLSTRYTVQNSCLGLYRRYSALASDGLGAWFCARTDLGHVVGTSSARLDGNGGCRVDGFVQRYYTDSWGELIQSATAWGAAKNASPIWTTVSVEDEEKLSLFESLGFRNVGPGESFDLGGRQVGTVRCELV